MSQKYAQINLHFAGLHGCSKSRYMQYWCHRRAARAKTTTAHRDRDVEMERKKRTNTLHSKLNYVSLSHIEIANNCAHWICGCIAATNYNNNVRTDDPPINIMPMCYIQAGLYLTLVVALAETISVVFNDYFIIIKTSDSAKRLNFEIKSMNISIHWVVFKSETNKIMRFIWQKPHEIFYLSFLFISFVCESFWIGRSLLLGTFNWLSALIATMASEVRYVCATLNVPKYVYILEKRESNQLSQKW